MFGKTIGCPKKNHPLPTGHNKSHTGPNPKTHDPIPSQDPQSSDQSLDKTSFDFFNIFHVMAICAMNAKSRIKPKHPKSMAT